MANWWESAPLASPLDIGLHQEGISGPLADLARSVYQQESGGGRNTRTSNAGAVGGMQILPGTFAEVADDGWDINDPIQNARAGLRYLNRMYEQGGNDPRMAAIGYYGGPGAIKAARAGQARTDPRNPQAPDTFQYADQVVARMPHTPGLVERAVNAVIPAAQAAEAAPSGNWWEQAELVSPAPQAAQQDGQWWESAPLVDAAPLAGTTQPEPDSGGYLPQIGSGLLEGVTGVLGAPIDLTNAAIGVGLKGVNALFGTDFQPSQEPLGGSRGLRKGLPIAPPSESTGPQIARRVSQSVGAALPFFGQARNLKQGAAALGTALGGGFGGATAQQLLPGNATAEMLGEALGSLGAGGTIASMANRSARKTAENAIPTVNALRARAGDLYDDAERLGVTATQQQTQGESARNH